MAVCRISTHSDEKFRARVLVLLCSANKTSNEIVLWTKQRCTSTFFLLGEKGSYGTRKLILTVYILWIYNYRLDTIGKPVNNVSEAKKTVPGSTNCLALLESSCKSSHVYLYHYFAFLLQRFTLKGSIWKRWLVNLCKSTTGIPTHSSLIISVQRHDKLQSPNRAEDRAVWFVHLCWNTMSPGNIGG